MKVFVDRIGKTTEINAKSIEEIAEKLKINLEEYIVVKNGALTTKDTKLENTDEIKLLSVVSGG